MIEEDVKIYNTDGFEMLKNLEDSSVDAIITDPPYCGVKGEDWDNQWDTEADFLSWIDKLIDEFSRVLKSNGSLYLFASSNMAGRVETVISARMNVLNHIVWVKGDLGKKRQHTGNRAEKESLRRYWPESERIIFAEHYNSDNSAKGVSGYVQACDELRGLIFEPLRVYLDGERIRAGVKPAQIIEWFAAHGLPKYVTTRHSFSQSQWKLPTKENYQYLRQCLNELAGGEYLRKDYEYLRKDYEYLRKDYEELRKDYEELRKDYEELRRPFYVDKKMSWSDLWFFEPVTSYPGKHSCEKPLLILIQAINASSRKNDLIVDPFVGSGSIAEACLMSGRRFIGSEINERFYMQACDRVEDYLSQHDLFT